MSKLTKIAALQQRITALGLTNITLNSSDNGSSRSYCYARITLSATAADGTSYSSSYGVSGLNHRKDPGSMAGRAFASWQEGLAAEKLKTGYTATSKIYEALVEICEMAEEAQALTA